MFPSYILHSSKAVERNEIVNDLINETGGTIFESYMLPNGKDGCRKSHIEIAKLAKEQHPLKHYFVFEDDCVLQENWKDALEGIEIADLVYLGYNDKSYHTVFGTHAVLISPRARDLIIEHAEEVKDEVVDKGAYDFILSYLRHKYKLITLMPNFAEREKYCYQKKKLRSQITGEIRE